MNNTVDKKTIFTLEEVASYIKEQLANGLARSEVRKLVAVRYNRRKSWCNEQISKVMGNTTVSTVVRAKVEDVKETKPVKVQTVTNDIFNTGFENKGNYLYNTKTKQYLVPTKSSPSGSVLISADKVQTLRQEYSIGKMSIGEISQKYIIPKQILVEVFAKLEISHSGGEFTNEELAEFTNTELITQSYERRKLELNAELEKEDLRRQTEDADKWRRFENGKLIPLQNFLSTWKAPQYTPTPRVIPQRVKSGRTFVIGAFDWHVGAKAEEKFLLRGGEWNIEIAQAAIRSYADRIATKIQEDPIGFDKGILLFGGDLYNSLTGYTSNGTQLENEVNGDTQFEAIMNSMIAFIEEMRTVFETLDIHFVRGNHGGITDICLAHAVRNLFLADRTIDFKIHSARVALFKQGTNYIAFEHGASDYTKAVMPIDAKGQEVTISRIFNSRKDLLAGARQQLYIMGDKHHFTHKEFADFEFIQMGSLPRGDKYAEARILYNKPRQNCLILDDEKGLEQILHFYFDKCTMENIGK